ncbi:hypothetical protein BGX26_005065, partial [Mortierella sp. AD094]
EEWRDKLEVLNDEEKESVATVQNKRFLSFMEAQSSQYKKDVPGTPDKKRRISFRSASSTTSYQRAQSSVGNLSDGDVVDALEVMMPSQTMGDVL